MAKQRPKETFGVKPGKSQLNGSLKDEMKTALVGAGLELSAVERSDGMPMTDRWTCYRVARECKPDWMPDKQAITVAFGVYWELWREQP